MHDVCEKKDLQAVKKQEASKITDYDCEVVLLKSGKSNFHIPSRIGKDGCGY